MSRYDLSNFLANTKRTNLDTNTINSFLPGLALLPEIPTTSQPAGTQANKPPTMTAEHNRQQAPSAPENGFSDYEYIERESTLRQSSQSGNTISNKDRNSYSGNRLSFNSNIGQMKSKSVHNLSLETSQEQPATGRSGGNGGKKIGGSMFSIQSRTLPRNSSGQSSDHQRKASPPRRGRGARGAGNLMKKRSMSSGNVFGLGGGGGRTKSPRRPEFIQQKSVENIYVDEEEQHQLAANDTEQLGEEAIISDSRYNNNNHGERVQEEEQGYADARTAAQSRGRRHHNLTFLYQLLDRE